ncbi:MAG TPA: sulfotransferase domain-containing protein [Isosphaeraceae bacterium]|nr:sulfotransferase domain-containing protein [Isosphaeraceae bacterium]
MVNEQDQNSQNSMHRLDPPGRLFRLEWNLFRAVRSVAAGSVSAGGMPANTDGGSLERPPSDVICGGMYRACSTWQYEVVSHLIIHYQGGQRLGYLTGEQYAAVFQPATPTSPEAPLRTGYRRVVKTHEGDRSFARALAERRARAVYAYRDVREVVFSLMHKRGMTFERLLRQGMIHQILANDRFWMAQPDVLVQRYDDLVADPVRGVMELARHLGISLEASEARQIASEYSHESNRARTEALRQRLQQAGVDLESTTNAQICDPTTLLHWNHIRGPKSKCWSALASQGQRSVLERLCGRWLRARGYSLVTIDSGHANISLRARLSMEFDLMVGKANFLIRSASQRWPRTARAIKRILGIPVDAQAGATAWADPTPSRSDARGLNPPHIPITGFSTVDERELVERDMRTS